VNETINSFDSHVDQLSLYTPFSIKYR